MKKIRRQVITNDKKIIILLTLLCLALVFTFCTNTVSAAPGDTIYVNGLNGNDDNDGLSWTTAKLSIKNATGTVNPNGTVNIAYGTYTGVNNTGITIGKNMTISGQSQSGTIINGTNTAQIFNILSGLNVTICNLTLVNGNNTRGGAIENNGNLTVNNCIFTSNTAGWNGTNTNYGGAINNQGTLTVNDSIFNNNSARVGGAIYNSPDSTLNVNNSIFNNNTARLGGAIYNHGSSIVKGTNFVNNVAQRGGAIFNLNYDLLLNVDNCIFTDNNATSNFGGAIYNNDGNVTVTDSIFTGNSALNRGGAVYNEGLLNVTGCTFTGNSAIPGGAIYNWGTLTVDNSTFTDNIADTGGAIYNQGSLTITNCTFTNNTATNTNGGAIHNDGGTCTVVGSVFTGNAAGSGGAIANFGTLTVTDSTFTQNTAACDGGALCGGDSTLTLNNCTFMGNKATSGGAIAVDYGISNVNSCTFTNNTAPGDIGGAILNGADNTMTVISSIFTGNIAGYGGAIFNGATLTAHFNRIVGNTANQGKDIYNSCGTGDANYNWWGSNNPDFANLIVVDGGSVNTSTWVILTVKANPTTINNGKTSTIIADFNHINGGGELIGGHIPDGHVTLDIPWGSFTSSGITHSVTANTVAGVMTVTFYANEGAAPSSPVKVTATADNYTTNDTGSAYITITKVSDLYIKITSDKKNPKVSKTFILAYKLGNKGPDDATNVTITIPLPEGFVISEIKGDGTWTINGNTITWTLTNVPVGDPYLYISGKVLSPGSYVFGSSIFSETYNIDSEGVTPIVINAVSEVNAANKTTNKTIPLQHTGIPFTGLILAILAVLGGFTMSKRKN